MRDAVKNVASMKAGGAICDGSPNSFKSLEEMILDSIPTVFLTVSAVFGVTKRIDHLYEEAKLAVEECDKENVRNSLRTLCEDHVLILDSALRNRGCRKEVIDATRILMSNFALDLIKYGETVLEKIWEDNGDENKSLQAILQSFGERLNAKVLHLYFQAVGMRVIYISALDFMRGNPVNDKFTGAAIDQEKSIRRLKHIMQEQFAIKLPNGNFYGTVILTEGFIGSFCGRIITYGYDGSDLTALLVGETIHAIRLSISPKTILLKKLDRRLRSMSLSRLRRMLRKSKSSLIGDQALEYAILHSIPIEIYDVGSRRRYLFSPSRDAANILSWWMMNW